MPAVRYACLRCTGVIEVPSADREWVVDCPACGAECLPIAARAPAIVVEYRPGMAAPSAVPESSPRGELIPARERRYQDEEDDDDEYEDDYRTRRQRQTESWNDWVSALLIILMIFGGGGKGRAAGPTLRPRNYCHSCGHEWQPRGHNYSRKCPQCRKIL